MWLEAETKELRELTRLYEYYSKHHLPKDLTERIVDIFGIDIRAKYHHRELPNPIIVAPGQMSMHDNQIDSEDRAGYGGLVLKSFVGEAPNGSCSMDFWRTEGNYTRTYYEPGYRVDGSRPIVHWNGKGDTRNLEDYLPFAVRTYKSRRRCRTVRIASIICHLPGTKDEKWMEEEWLYTTKVLSDVGYKIFEIAFSPTPSVLEKAKDRDIVLEWYRTAPKIMRRARDDIVIYPKIMNMRWGLNYQFQMVEASFEGSSDGVVVANRMFNRKFKSGHGGRALLKTNLKQIRRVRREGLDIPISGTGGIYTGVEAIAYLLAGAENVQLLSYIMGKVKIPINHVDNQFAQVLYELILNPYNGLIRAGLHLKNRHGISSLAKIDSRSRELQETYREICAYITRKPS